MAAALLNWVGHQCYIVKIRTHSYRLRRHVELSQPIRPTASRKVSAQE